MTPVDAVETQTMTVAQAINQALDEAMSVDERVILMGEDIGEPGGIAGFTAGLWDKHGADRVLDTPISEAAIVGAAIGASMDGLIPVAEIMIMDFIGIALDQIVNHAAKLRYMSAGRTTCPITVRTMVFSGLGTGATHSQTLESWFMHIPGLKLIVPSTPADAKGLMTAAIFDPDPCVFVETMITSGRSGPVPVAPGYMVPIGKADIKRAGSDVTVITYGRDVFDALDAAEALKDEGIDVEVLDLRTLLPLDLPTILESVGRTKRAVVVHQATQFAGPGAEVAAAIHHELFGELAAPVERVGAPFAPIPAPQHLYELYAPNPNRIADAVRTAMGASRG